MDRSWDWGLGRRLLNLGGDWLNRRAEEAPVKHIKSGDELFRSSSAWSVKEFIKFPGALTSAAVVFSGDVGVCGSKKSQVGCKFIGRDFGSEVVHPL